jgi:hypothetical protein
MARGFIGFVVAIAVLWTSNAISQTALTEQQPAAKIVVDPPLAEPLSRGVVFIQYRTENLQIVPVFGPKALDVSPRMGISMSQLMGRRGSGPKPAAALSSSLVFLRDRIRSRLRP